VTTDTIAIEHLLTHQVTEVISKEELRDRLMSGRVLRIKLGADPTSPDLHLGHAVVLRKLREFQDLGHTVILIIGDYTALVGDPSGKSKTRPMLTQEEIDINAQTYLNQVGKILDLSKTEIHRNSEWLGTITMAELIKLASKFTVARLIERDDFANRLNEGIDVSMHELLYPMMQAYDSVMINADVEIGGTDQKFNNLAGRELQKKMNQTPQNVMLCPILVGLDGEKKMSKSLHNYIGIDEAPAEMYGKAMSIPDTAIEEYFALATNITADKISAIVSDMNNGSLNPRDAKMQLARDIVRQYHGDSAVGPAEERFISMFQKKEIPDDILEISLDVPEMLLIDILVAAEFAKSKSEARQLIEQGGVKVDNEVIEDVQKSISLSSHPVLIQKGKRFFVKVKK
jgi:tyrosyl-tRNA synthetase